MLSLSKTPSDALSAFEPPEGMSWLKDTAEHWLGEIAFECVNFAESACRRRLSLPKTPSPLSDKELRCWPIELVRPTMNPHKRRIEGVPPEYSVGLVNKRLTI